MKLIVSFASLITVMFTTCLLMYVISFDSKSFQSISPDVTIRMEAKDSIPVFSSREITVDACGIDQIDYLVLTSENNWLWESPDSIINKGKLREKMPLSFMVSFSDTGWKYIQCVIQLTSGESVIRSVQVYVYSPLLPKVIECSGDTILFYTPAVEDNVSYVWEFRGGPVIYTNLAQSRIQLKQKLPIGGRLYVKTDGVVSPSIPFQLQSN